MAKSVWYLIPGALIVIGISMLLLAPLEPFRGLDNLGLSGIVLGGIVLGALIVGDRIAAAIQRSESELRARLIDFSVGSSDRGAWQFHSDVQALGTLDVLVGTSSSPGLIEALSGLAAGVPTARVRVIAPEGHAAFERMESNSTSKTRHRRQMRQVKEQTCQTILLATKYCCLLADNPGVPLGILIPAGDPRFAASRADFDRLWASGTPRVSVS